MCHCSSGDLLTYGLIASFWVHARKSNGQLHCNFKAKLMCGHSVKKLAAVRFETLLSCLVELDKSFRLRARAGFYVH